MLNARRPAGWRVLVKVLVMVCFLVVVFVFPAYFRLPQVYVRFPPRPVAVVEYIKSR